MKTRLLTFLTLSGCLALGSTSQAQAPRAPQIQSPVVHPDRTATFSFRAPVAKKVELTAQFLKGSQPLTPDTNGVWSVTVGPIEPNLYPYNFVVDGVGIADSANQDLFPNERFKASLVDVPGDKPALHSVQDVPHGDLTYCYYQSRVLNRTRPLIVYTPPSYRKGNGRYPVLYLVSGTTDTEETWFKVGRANFILDNLIAQKKAVPDIMFP